MARFKIKADYLSSDEIEIEADSEAEAKQKFDDGDYDPSAESNTDYQLYEFKSIEQVKE